MKRNLFFIICCVVIFNSSLVFAANKNIVEDHKLKAIFIFNFINYIKWPDKDGSKGAKIACIYGDDDVYRNLLKISELSKGVMVPEIKFSLEYEGCDLIYISKEVDNKIKPILSKVYGQPILTVSDSNGFAVDRGGIGFVKRKSKIIFEINISNLKNANLVASSKLLKLAKVLK